MAAYTWVPVRALLGTGNAGQTPASQRRRLVTAVELPAADYGGGQVDTTFAPGALAACSQVPLQGAGPQLHPPPAKMQQGNVTVEKAATQDA